MATKILVTCEHGGNFVPVRFKESFKNGAAILDSHRGWDPGALDLARCLHRKLQIPIVYEHITRLLIDQNRSLTSRSLFSEFSENVSPLKKKYLLKRYTSYHQKVMNFVDTMIKVDDVIHLSIHSFTPVLNGKIRTADIGILYDPHRNHEKEIAAELIHVFSTEFPDLRFRRNYPYRGTSDGFTKLLRQKYKDPHYCGLELEFNQALLLKNTALAKALKQKIPQIIQILF
jgi:predicted N-formylglutamate amidohydrolase